MDSGSEQKLTNENDNDVGGAKNDAPAAVVVRRRRRIVRHHVREKTPEPSAKNGAATKQKYSDDESSNAETTGGSSNNRKTHRQYATDASTNTAVPSSSSPPPSPPQPSSRIIPAPPITVEPAVESAIPLHQPSSPPASVKSAAMSAHRSKILSRRDRHIGTAAVRSQSTPRDESKVTAAESGQTTLMIRPVKRSLSSPRHKEEFVEIDRASPPHSHHHHERDSSAPVREIPTSTPPLSLSPAKHTAIDTSQAVLSKLERNLRRFEEERRRFEMEKRKFDEEKREADRVRQRRLEEFERKRAIQKKEELRQQEDVHQKLYSILRVIEDSKHHLPSALKLNHQLSTTSTTEDEQSLQRPPAPPPRYVVRGEESLEFPETIHPCPLPESPDFHREDDYESSTALSSSSRDGDFDDDDDAGILTVVERPIEEKVPVVVAAAEVPTTEPKKPVKQSFLGRLFGRKPTVPAPLAPSPPKVIEAPSMGPVTLRRFFFVETRLVWHQLLADHPTEWQATMRMRNKCIADLIVMTIFCGLGGITFRFVEGAFENFYKCGVRRVKRDFVDNLWHTSHNLREDDWKNAARTKLRKFEEELHAAHEAGMTSYSGMKAWTFINGMIYCMTVVTTIGYGHIYPSTNTGRAITIAYAIIGIPMFLILLADFGKLFTRGIKFLWAYVRRLYYTGSLRKVRKQAQVQEMIRGMNMAYEIATFRRPSVMVKENPDIESHSTETNVNATGAAAVNNNNNKNNINSNTLPPPPTTPSSAHLTAVPSSGTPTTPVPTELDIDDEFNLPISLAFIILLAYIFCGAAVYSIWEDWSFFESCYFVFISMSTIGFGDYVPKHPIYMMTSIIYLVFGLALTSMCINVVQVKLSDSFRQASAKIGATIGLTMAAEEEAALNSLVGTPACGVAEATVHGAGTGDAKANEANEVATPPPLLPKKKDSLVVDGNKNNEKDKKAKKKSKK